MVTILVVIFASVFGVSAPEVGTPCDDALASLRSKGLQMVSSDPSGPAFVFSLSSPLTKRVAIIGCGPEGLLEPPTATE